MRMLSEVVRALKENWIFCFNYSKIDLLCQDPVNYISELLTIFNPLNELGLVGLAHSAQQPAVNPGNWGAVLVPSAHPLSGLRHDVYNLLAICF